MTVVILVIMMSISYFEIKSLDPGRVLFFDDSIILFNKDELEKEIEFSSDVIADVDFIFLGESIDDVRFRTTRPRDTNGDRNVEYLPELVGVSFQIGKTRIIINKRTKWSFTNPDEIWSVFYPLVKQHNTKRGRR